MKRWQQLAIYGLFLLVSWAGLVAWQWHEYSHEWQAARETLLRQAASITSALVGGIRSHRRMGPYFEDQLQATLDELVRAEDILAVAVVSQSGNMVVSAGDTALLGKDAAPSLSTNATDRGFRYTVDFHLEPEAAGEHGAGGGWGRGRGRRWLETEGDAAQSCPTESPFSSGGDYAAVLVLDRTQADARVAGALRLRTAVVIAGGGILLCLGLAWLATVWFLEAQGRTRVLEAEARHLRELSQAAAGLAHETRNPLGLIRGWTQRLASHLPSAELKEQAGAVIEECDRVTARINQFLAFAGPVQPSPEPMDLDRLVDELAVILAPDLDGKGLKLVHEPPGGHWTVRADREMLRQALFNLIRNAAQFSPDQGTVEIRVRSGQGAGCRIEVADRGPGVPEEHAASLFTPYFTTRSDGTGLGLAIVRRIAAAHGWDTGYRPRPGGGSVFWLEIHD